MTYQNNFTLSAALLEQLTSGGLDALPTLFQVLLNAAMQIERQNHLGAAPHERTQERTGYANGFKDKTVNTSIGQITLAVPQVREVNADGHVLQDLGMDVADFGELLAPLRERLMLVVAAWGLAEKLEVMLAPIQQGVVDQAARLQRMGQFPFLLLVGVEPVFWA